MKSNTVFGYWHLLPIIVDYDTKRGSSCEIPFLINFHKIPLHFGHLHSGGTKVGQNG
jgi:hypothetical protein